MSLAALIRAMSDAGAPPEAIAIAVEAIEAEQDKAAAKRADAARRKAEERERKRMSRDSHATGTGQDCDNPDLVSLDKESPHTPKKIISSPGLDSLRACEDLDLPEGVSTELWTQYRAMRKKIRKPLNANAERLALKHLRQFAEDGHPPGEIVEAAIVGSYQGLFPPKGTKNGHRKPDTEHQWGRTVAAADALIDELRAGSSVHG